MSSLVDTQNAARPYILGQLNGVILLLPPFPKREQLGGVFPPKMLQRLVAAGWLVKVDMGARETHFSLPSVFAAIDRISSGEQPPRLPSEPVPTGKRHVPGRLSTLHALAA